MSVIPAHRPPRGPTSYGVDPANLNRASAVPLYQQLAHQLQRAIATGELQPGSRLGNERTERPVQLSSIFDDLARTQQHPKTRVLINEVPDRYSFTVTLVGR